jgi:hypothetical protein
MADFRPAVIQNLGVASPGVFQGIGQGQPGSVVARVPGQRLQQNVYLVHRLPAQKGNTVKAANRKGIP